MTANASTTPLRRKIPFLKSEKGLLVLGIIAVISSLMLWWSNNLSRTVYPRHIALADSLDQADRAINQALLKQARRMAGESVERRSIYSDLSLASLHINDCLEGRSSLQGIVAKKPTGTTLSQLKTYAAALEHLEQTIRNQLTSGEISEPLQIEKLRDFHDLNQISDTIKTDLARQLTEVIREQQLELRIGLGIWFGFLFTAFFILYRAGRIEAIQAQQEQLIRTFLDSTSDAIFVKDAAGRYLLCNHAALRYMGKTEVEVVGEDDRAIFPPEEAERLMAKDRHTMEVGEASHHEAELTTAQGDRLIFLVSKGVLHDRDGRVTGVFGISRDITQQRKDEVQLEHHRRLLQRTSQLAKVGGWEFDPQTLQGTWTEECARIHDLDPAEEVNVADGLSYYHGESRRIIEKAVQEAIEGGKPYDLELELVSAKGVHKWVRTKCELTIEDGRVCHIGGAIQDITERKEMEKNLAESELRYRTLFEQSLDAIAVMEDFPPRFTFVNPAFVELFGYTEEEMRKMGGDAAWKLVLPEDLPIVQESLKSRMAGATPSARYEFRIARKDGGIRWVDVAGSRINLGEKIVVQSLYRDITERKKAEAERYRLEEQLAQAQKMESIGRLAGGVAHDYNNMLNVILGYAELALEGLTEDQPIYGDLKEIYQAAQRSAEITRQLLAFARKQTIAPTPLDLNDTIAGMLKMLQRLIGEAIDLCWHPLASLWLVKMDPSQVDQILANLCVNARDAIVDTGTITIETANITLDEYSSTGHIDCAAGEYVMFSVSDDGVGMDKATLARVFEPFYTTKEVGEGTGLGMSTVYGIVKQNNGSIHIYSELGKGTTVRIYIPRYTGDDKISLEHESEFVAKGQGELLLLVEDEETVGRMAQAILQNYGYKVLAARTPAEAMALMNEHGKYVELLITDVIMPEMNGRELADRLHVVYPELKVLFMSGYTANAIAHHGVLDEGVHYIQKPFSKKGLAEKVHQALFPGL